MPFYEYQCGKGHVTTLLRPIAERDAWAACETCIEEMRVLGEQHPDACSAWNPQAKRILSPTPTTFRFASGTKY